MWDVCVVGKQIIVISPLCSPVSPLTLPPPPGSDWLIFPPGWCGVSQARRDRVSGPALSLPLPDTHRTLSGSCLVFLLLQKTDTGQETEVHSPVQERQSRIRSERFYSARPLTVVRVLVCWEQWEELDTLPLPVLCTCYNNITTVPVTNTTTPPGHHGPKHQGPASHTEADHSVFQEGWSSSGQSSDESSQSNVVYGHWHWLYLHLRWELPGHQSYSLPQWTAVPCIRQVSTYNAIGFL